MRVIEVCAVVDGGLFGGSTPEDLRTPCVTSKNISFSLPFSFLASGVIELQRFHSPHPTWFNDPVTSS